jgi:uncharacterized membrane protein YedE/YeeE
MNIIEIISQPWHWAFSGAMIALVLILLTWMGRSFGVSLSFRNICSISGAGKKNSFFNINLKDEYWRMVFVIGGIVGGIIGFTLLKSPEPVAIAESTIQNLKSLGLDYPASDEKGLGFVPTTMYNFGNLKGVIFAILGGFLVGFGSRYGDGCTSGHAISGLSHLQISSLITVIGFFIGGLIMTHLLMPLFFTL